MLLCLLVFPPPRQIHDSYTGFLSFPSHHPSPIRAFARVSSSSTVPGKVCVAAFLGFLSAATPGVWSVQLLAAPYFRWTVGSVRPEPSPHSPLCLGALGVPRVPWANELSMPLMGRGGSAGLAAHPRRCP